MFQLTDRTFTILKNFSQISDNLLIYPGSTLRTVSRMMASGASAKIQETFPCEIPIYYLTKMLSIINALGTNVYMDFDTHHVTLIAPNKKTKTRWLYSEPGMVHGAKNSDLQITSIGELVMTKEDYQQLRSVGSTLENPDVLFKANADGASIISTNLTRKAPEELTIDVEKFNTTQPFNMALKLERLALVPDEYVVQTDGKRVLQFVTKDVTYWTAAKEVV